MARAIIGFRAAGVAMLAMALAAPVWTQQPKAFAAGDAAAGKALSDKDCVTCHQRQFGDANRIYLRADRKVRTPEQLMAQVQRCNTELATNYFPDDEEHVAAYLNLAFYKFAP